MDTDAHATFSDVIRVDRDINEKTVVVSPNPFTNRLQLSITSPVADRITLAITGANGQQLWKAAKPLTAGTNVITINETAGFPQGTYQLSILSANALQTITVIKTN